MNARRIATVLLCALALGACSSQRTSPLPAMQPLALQPQLTSAAGIGVFGRRVCAPAGLGYGRCFAIVRTEDNGDVMHAAGAGDLVRLYQRACFKGNAVCYAPQDLWKAYNLPSSTKGRGQTVAVVDAYGDPAAETDLAKYRSHYGLPPCTTANHCFLKVSGTGSTTKFPPLDQSWAGEESLDVDMVSAVCPKCHIILVEAITNSFKNFAQAERTAVTRGATVISNSWGGNEYAASDPAYAPAHVAVTASAGDNGYDTCASSYGCVGPQEPASFASVIAVGGTTLLPDSTVARGFTEKAWNCYTDASGACGLSTIFATGSGCSARVSKPAWQTDHGCAKRSYNDVSAIADLVTGVVVYDSYYGGFTVYGGTSVASPIVAAAIALQGNAAQLHGAQSIWQSKGANFFDVVRGQNVIPASGVGGGNGTFPRTCAKAIAYICTAGPGYDGPTGWGTPSGVSGL